MPGVNNIYVELSQHNPAKYPQFHDGRRDDSFMLTHHYQHRWLKVCVLPTHLYRLWEWFGTQGNDMRIIKT